MAVSHKAKAPRLPIEILEIIIQDLIQDRPAHEALANLRKFRLISKSFAEAGLSYITHSLRLVRLPAAFDRADEIANHVTARFNVERLICSGQPFNPPPDKRQPRFQNDGEDIARLRQIIKKLPNLKTLQLDCFKRKPPKTTRPTRFPAAIFGGKQSSERDGEEFVDLDILDVLSEAPHIEYLLLSRIDLPTMWHFPAEGFPTLRKLSIWINGQRNDSRLLPSLIKLHSLEIFEFRYSDLDYIRWSFTLPAGLKCLGLSGVEIHPDEIPMTLNELCLSNVKLVGGVVGWTNIFFNWPPGCELFLLGPIMASYDVYGWTDLLVTPWDPILNTTLSEVLKEICFTPRKYDDVFRQTLLREIFRNPRNISRPFGSPIRSLFISPELYEIYCAIDHPPPPTKLTPPRWVYAI